MDTHHASRRPFHSPTPDYRAFWQANLVWGILALALLVFALAIWGFFAAGWYQPPVEAPIEVPAVEGPSPVTAPSQRAEAPPATPQS